MAVAQPRLKSLAIALLALLALIGSTVAGSRLASASPGRHPRLVAPSQVVPGSTVPLTVRRFPKRAQVRIQFAVRFPHSFANCCASAPFPPVGEPGIRLDRRGHKRLRVTVPTEYAQCTSSACPGPEFQPYTCGQLIWITAYTYTGEGVNHPSVVSCPVDVGAAGSGRALFAPPAP